MPQEPEKERDAQEQLDDHEERLQRIEGALRAGCVVFAIPRIPDPEEKR